LSRYLIATLEIKPAAMGRWLETMGVMQEILTGVGWRLVGAYNLRSGLAGTVIDIWEMSDLEQLDVGFAALAQDPRWPQIQAGLSESIIRETVQFADSLSFPAPAG
jgi:NIPSNAP